MTFKQRASVLCRQKKWNPDIVPDIEFAIRSAYQEGLEDAASLVDKRFIKLYSEGICKSIRELKDRAK
jgi:hypothetical protein